MQNLSIGSILRGGTYRIDKVLGQGSFGITYLAEHTGLGKKVAIKEFFMKELNNRGDDGSITGMSDSSLSFNYCQKFKKEAINLSHLDHPNIVRVTDSFEENGTYYYVMDYIEGQNLNEYVKAWKIGEDEAVSIIKNVANALIYMHDQKHMLHLDLKPGNVMRRASDGHIFLIDFGLSKHYSNDGQPETSTTIGLGTPGYAPIEQANQSKNGEFRPTIDVYALGATLFKLLTGETPPVASELVSDDELLEEKLRASNVSPNLTNAVMQAMLPNVKKRTQTVSAFVASLGGTPTVNAAAQNGVETATSNTDNERTIVGGAPAPTPNTQGEETQLISEPRLDISQTRVYFPAKADLRRTVLVTSSGDWHVQVAPDAWWIMVKKIDNSHLEISVGLNDGELRTGDVVIVNGHLTRTITVSQRKPDDVSGGRSYPSGGSNYNNTAGSSNGGENWGCLVATLVGVALLIFGVVMYNGCGNEVKGEYYDSDSVCDTTMVTEDYYGEDTTADYYAADTTAFYADTIYQP